MSSASTTSGVGLAGGAPVRLPAPSRTTGSPRPAGIGRAPSPVATGGPPRISRAGNRATGALLQRKCAHCAAGGAPCADCEEEEEEQATTLQRSAEAGAPAVGPAAGVPASVRQVLGAPGSPLPAPTLGAMESGFAHSFGDVRVHTGARAAESAAAVDAVAYTVGTHVVFGGGRFAPGTPHGDRLLAHELAHVVQQRGARVDLDRLAVDRDVSSPAEREADGAATRVVSGQRAVVPPTAGARVQRARLQRKMVEDEAAGGCGICHGPQDAGIEAHKLIQLAFRASYFDAVAATKPGKPFTGNVHLSEKEIKLIGSAPGDDNFRLDIAVVEPSGRLSIGEIKPANKNGLEEGTAQVDFYADLITERRGERPSRMRAPIVPGPIPFLNPLAGDCPIPQLLHVNPATPEGVYTYYCTPTRKKLMENPKCRCWKRRKKKEERKEKREEKRDPKDVRPPVPVTPPVPVAPPVGEDKPETPGVPDRPPVQVPEAPPVQEPVRPPPVEVPEGPWVPPVLVPGEPEVKPPVGGDKGGKVIEGPWGKPKDKPPVPVVDEEDVKTAARVAAAVALLALAVRYGAKKLGKAALGRALAPVMAAAAVLLIANGAEASIGLDGDDALEALYKTAGQKGLDIPDDLKEAIKKDPKLKELLVNSGKKGGDMTAAQQKAAEQLTRTIIEHRDEFSDEELEELAKDIEVTKGALPKGDVTVEEIKKQIAARKAGATGKGGGGGSGSGEPIVPEPPPPAGTGKVESPAKVPAPGEAPPPLPGIPDDLRKRLADDKAATAILKEIVTEQEGAPKLDAKFAEGLLAITKGASPPLTEKEAAELAAVVTSARGKTADEVLETVRKAVASRRPAAGAGPGEGGPGQPAPGAPPATGPAPPTGEAPAPAPSVPTVVSGGQIDASPAAKKAKLDKTAAEVAKIVLEDPAKFDGIVKGQIILYGTSPVTIQRGVRL
ncbi:MAG: eCIS core domain-containing protein, partial [Gemmatimonadaceae bacterium]